MARQQMRKAAANWCKWTDVSLPGNNRVDEMATINPHVSRERRH